MCTGELVLSVLRLDHLAGFCGNSYEILVNHNSLKFACYLLD